MLQHVGTKQKPHVLKVKVKVKAVPFHAKQARAEVEL
jgi:hypothetical protein